MATQKGRNWSSGDIVTAANLSSIERGVSAVAEEYTPTTWANGNTITAAVLNNIEQGIVSGGGSSDFSTAQVTFIIQNGASATITNLFLVFGQVGERYWVYREEIPFTAGTATLPLVDGDSSFGIVPDSGVAVMVSGNAEYYSEDEEIGVTGDCTITISGGEIVA